jgi:chitinase
MKKTILFLLALSLFFSCKKKEDDDKGLLLGAALIASQPANTIATPPDTKETYSNGSSFTVTVGQSVRFTPPNHVEGSKYTVSPALPSGLALEENSGVISGTPTVALASIQYTVTQTKPDNTTATFVFTIIVNATTDGGGGTPETVATPTFSPDAGTYTSAQSVTIASTTSSAEIRYTTDGTEPTCTTGTVYSAAVSITATTTLKAIGCKTGATASSVVSGAYTISGGTPETVATPTFSPAAGTYTSAQNVTITSTTDSAEIHYTTNGTSLLVQQEQCILFR